VTIVKLNPDGSDPGGKPTGEPIPVQYPTTTTEEDTTAYTEETTTEIEATTPEPDPLDGLDWRLLPPGKILASSLFDMCGPEKGGKTCFAYPEGCVAHRTCRIAAALSNTVVNNPNQSPSNSWVKIEMAATSPKGFVAIGFSNDRFMGDDFVMYCGHGPTGHSVTLHMAQNEGYKNIMEVFIQCYEYILALYKVIESSFQIDSQKDEEKVLQNTRRRKGYAQENGVVACEFDVGDHVLPNQKAKGEAIDGWHIFLAFGRFYNMLEFNDTDYGER
jgi:hypothetical protein